MDEATWSPLGTDARQELARQVGESVLRIASQLEEMFRRASAPEELEPIDARLLALAVEGDRLGLAALAERLGCDPPRVTDIANRLERRGMLRRVVSRSDRRVRHLQATDAGRAALARIGERLVETSPLMRMSEADLSRVASALARVPGRPSA